MRQRPCLTLEDVKKLTTACDAQAARNEWIVTIAIVDEARSRVARVGSGRSA